MMKNVSLCLLASLLLSLALARPCVALKQGKEHYEKEGLLMAIVITRHGDRTPVTIYQNSMSEWLEGSGQLTGLGMKQQHDLGVNFRKRYIESASLVDNHWRIDQVYARSTSRCRTLQSAHSFMMGFFPPGTGPNLPVGEGGGPALPINIQPVPVHSSARYNDTLLYAYKNCPRLKRLVKATRVSDEWRAKEVEYAVLLDQLSEIFGERIKLKHMTSIKTLINAERIHGKPQLPGVTERMIEQLNEIGPWVIRQKFHSHEMGKLAAGQLPAEIRNRMHNMVVDHFDELHPHHHKSNYSSRDDGDAAAAFGGDEGAEQRPPHKRPTEASPKDTQTPRNILRKKSYKEPPFVLFSAHDGTLLALLSALRANTERVPYFSSHVVFELYAGHGPLDEPYVTITYDDEPLSIPGCGHTCSFDQFSQVIDRSYEPHWEHVCDIEWLRPIVGGPAQQGQLADIEVAPPTETNEAIQARESDKEATNVDSSNDIEWLSSTNIIAFLLGIVLTTFAHQLLGSRSSKHGRHRKHR
jgi:Histidine phosphatase superfamily (branch 2)